MADIINPLEDPDILSEYIKENADPVLTVVANPAIPDDLSEYYGSGTDDNITTFDDPLGTSLSDLTSNQESTNEEEYYNDALAKAAAAESATKEAIAGSTRSIGADPSAARLEASGVPSGAQPPKKSPAAPSVSSGGVKKEDLRVRIALAPQSPNIFYKDSKNDLLKPLKETDGVIFPIQPTISIGHEARYQATDLTHSNFTFQNYQNSAVKPLTLTGDFLIRNPREGRYCIAAIRFLQAMTKMFNANDTANNMKGAPPAVARLYGLGLMGFDSIPVVITSVDVNFGNDADLLSLAVAIDGSTEVTKLPASFQITVSMNPIFSREFATNFFGTQDYASGKVRLLGKQVIKPIATANVTPTASAAGTSTTSAANGNTTSTSNGMAKPDSLAGTSGGSAGTGTGVKAVSTPGSGTDTSTEVSKEKTTTLNADGSTTVVTTETVNGKKTVTTSITDADGKTTTKVSDGASGTGADSSSTKSNAAGNGGDSTQPKEEDAAASDAEKLRQLEADFRSKGEAIERQIESQMERIRTALEQQAPLALANLERNISTEQADLAVMENIVTRAEGGAAFPIEGYPNLEAVKRDMEVARNTIAGLQARVAGGSPYGFSESQLNSFATSSSEYVSAKAKLQAEVNNLQSLSSQSYNAGIGSKGGTSFLYSSISASYFVDPPEVQINGRTI